MTKSGKCEWPHDRTISVDVALIESDAREESLQRCVAMAQEGLPIKSAARLVDDR